MGVDDQRGGEIVVPGNRDNQRLAAGAVGNGGEEGRRSSEEAAGDVRQQGGAYKTQVVRLMLGEVKMRQRTIGRRHSAAVARAPQSRV